MRFQATRSRPPRGAIAYEIAFTRRGVLNAMTVQGDRTVVELEIDDNIDGIGDE